jgi:hydrogenase nickel incorporation protein HypB
VVLLSVPEGDDKPAKYPVMFRAAELLLLSKCDLLPVLDDFQPENARRNLQALANAAPVIELSAKTGAGMDEWLQWLRTEHAALKSRQTHEQAAAGAP